MYLISQELGIAINTVKKYIRLFEKYKIISVKRKRNIKGKWGVNEYTLLDKNHWDKPKEILWKKKRVVQSQSLATDNTNTQSQPLTEPGAMVDETQGQPLDNREDSVLRKTQYN